ncbi:hypothetical protein DL768_011148 [Monosporascus sp. mg162]|nr:hypothetical protein DL768_011148 [Monosporascus sp. mg162]
MYIVPGILKDDSDALRDHLVKAPRNGSIPKSQYREVDNATATAGTVVFALVKPPLVKLSNIIGRGSYALTISPYCLSYVLMAASKNFGTYVVRSSLCSIGQSSTNLLIGIVITDITTARYRRLARNQRGAAHRPAIFEHHLAKHPLVSPRCFSDRTIAPCLLVSLDSVGFVVTRTYIYAGATAAKGVGRRGATFFTSVNGIAQCLAGAAMVTTRRYKWICVLGAAMRLTGYGAVRWLRGAENGIAEVSPSSSGRTPVRAC